MEVEEEVEEGYGSCMMEDRLPHHSWDWRAQSQVLAKLGTQITSMSSSSPAGETTVSQSVSQYSLPSFWSHHSSQGLSVSSPGTTLPLPPPNSLSQETSLASTQVVIFILNLVSQLTTITDIPNIQERNYMTFTHHTAQSEEQFLKYLFIPNKCSKLLEAAYNSFSMNYLIKLKRKFSCSKSGFRSL